MASTNQSPFYQAAEKRFLEAQTDDERLTALEEMIKECPKHKSSENMRKNLSLRYKKLKGGIEKRKSSGKSKQQGIKKADMQAVIVGPANSGKSTLFNLLTNQKTKTTQNPFTTSGPQLGSLDYEDTKIQIIDTPSFPNANFGLINSTDTLLLVVDDLDQIKNSQEYLKKTKAKIILLFNKTDKLDEKGKRKIQATIKSKYKHTFFLISSTSPEEETLKELEETLFKTFPIIRVYTKEPRKPATNRPLILKRKSTVRRVAEKILKGLSTKVERARIWGPSSKFSGQAVGLEHILKDKDIVELQTK
jgi:uncharacterized protein